MHFAILFLYDNRTIPSTCRRKTVTTVASKSEILTLNPLNYTHTTD